MKYPGKGQIMDVRPDEFEPVPTPRRPGRLVAQGNKQPLNLRMDAGVILRLKTYAIRKGRTVSDLVTELVLGCLEEESDSAGTKLDR